MQGAACVVVFAQPYPVYEYKSIMGVFFIRQYLQSKAESTERVLEILIND